YNLWVNREALAESLIRMDRFLTSLGYLQGEPLGGNLLLNVGPDGNGGVQPEAIAILLETGKLLKANPIKKSHPTITAVPRIKQDKPGQTKE
ncbi:MAG: alpha-L-fucosidase, partial [Chthoniobacterales bacterium]